MNKRERMLLMLIGTGIGLFAIYQGINFLFVKPIADAKVSISELSDENDKLSRLMNSRKRLVKEWQQSASRTISYDAAEASNRISKDIKQTAARHGFETPNVAPAGQGKIGSKTGITTIVYRVSVDGPYAKAIDFMNEIYRLPYMVQISRLSITPNPKKGGSRDDVKLEFSVETPLLPRIDKKKMPDAAQAPAMLESDNPPTSPAREDLPDDDALAILKTRNIFRAFVPPPVNTVKIDNKDRKAVDVKVTFFWEGTPGEQLVEKVAGTSLKPVSSKGDVVEIQGSYDDKVKFGPERLDFNVRKDATYVVMSHTPPPPPEVVDLAVDNQTKEPVDVEVTLTLTDGKKKTPPTMRMKAGKTDIDEYKGITSVQVVAKYASGKSAAPMSFTPKAGKQTYVIPLESAPPVTPPPQQVVAVGDPPPDPTMSVSGLVTYNGTQEMVGSAGGTRKVFTAGIDAAVDGGLLLGVHPLGGVVRMPSGNFYLYPLGRKFAERVKLAATHEEDLAAAIDACSLELAAAPAAPATATPAGPAGAPGMRPPPRPQPQQPVNPGMPGKTNGRPR